MLEVDPDVLEDPIATAQRRLRCYYECVTRDMAPEDLEDEFEGFGLELDDDDELGLPRY